MKKLIKYLFIFTFFSLNLLPLFAQQRKDFEKLFSMPEIERRAAEKYIQQKNLPTKRYQDDLVVTANDTLNQNIFINHGDLLVQGTINGDVLVLLGDVRIESKAVINGNVTAINGKIRQEPQSIVTGNQIETNLKNLFPAREFGKNYDEDLLDKYLSRYTKPYGTGYSTVNFSGRKKSGFLFRYNRVQGAFLGISFPKFIKSKYEYLSIHGFLGYGLSDKKTRYSVSFDHWFFNKAKYRFELGVSLYDKIESKDTWLISSLENTLAAFFLNDDYLDYYRRKGYEFHVSQNLTSYFKAKFAYRNDQYFNVSKTTDWALFKDKDRFPINPDINSGRMRSLYGEVYWDSRNNRQRPHAGWFIKLSGESSTKKLKSDFSFNQYIFELRHYLHLGPYERLDVRLKVASSQGTVPLQKRFHLGGISTLRAFNYRSLDAEGSGGDRMVLLNLEYNINPRLFHSILFFSDEFNYIVFFDLGDVWNRKQVSSKDDWRQGFSHLKFNRLKSDLGLSLASPSGRFRINLAKRLDTSHKAWKISLRLNKPF